MRYVISLDRYSQIKIKYDKGLGIRNIIGIVDSSAFQIEKPTIGESQFYSVKHKQHVIKYEVVTSILNPQIIYFNGPFLGSMHDLTISRQGLFN